MLNVTSLKENIFNLNEQPILSNNNQLTDWIPSVASISTYLIFFNHSAVFIKANPAVNKTAI